MAHEQLTDTEKAERYAALFERLVTPLLTRYMELKAKGADPATTHRAKRAYERAHGRYNEQHADDDLAEAHAQLTGTDAGTPHKDGRTDG